MLKRWKDFFISNIINKQEKCSCKQTNKQWMLHIMVLDGMDHRVGWGIECANNRSTNRDRRDEMGKKKRLPFKLGFVELSDGETVVNVGIHCRLLLTKVGRWLMTKFLFGQMSQFDVKGESKGVPSVMKSESTTKYYLTSNVSADVGFDCRLWIKLIKTKLCIFKVLSTL